MKTLRNRFWKGQVWTVPGQGSRQLKRQDMVPTSTNSEFAAMLHGSTCFFFVSWAMPWYAMVPWMQDDERQISSKVTSCHDSEMSKLGSLVRSSQDSLLQVQDQCSQLGAQKDSEGLNGWMLSIRTLRASRDVEQWHWVVKGRSWFMNHWLKERFQFKQSKPNKQKAFKVEGFTSWLSVFADWMALSLQWEVKPEAQHPNGEAWGLRWFSFTDTKIKVLRGLTTC